MDKCKDCVIPGYGCNPCGPAYKTNCYWYGEEHDMNATIPYCKAKNIFPLAAKDCFECAGGEYPDYHPANKKTNADRIRSMTDKELAEQLAPCACPPTRFNKNTGDIVCPVNKEPCESDCRQCWLDWLKEEET